MHGGATNAVLPSVERPARRVARQLTRTVSPVPLLDAPRNGWPRVQARSREEEWCAAPLEYTQHRAARPATTDDALGPAHAHTHLGVGAPGGDPASALRPSTYDTSPGGEAALGAALNEALWDGSLDTLLNNTRYARMLMASPGVASPKSRRAVPPEPKDARDLRRLNRALQLELRAQREANDALLLAASDAQRAKALAEEIAAVQLREAASTRAVQAQAGAEHGGGRPWGVAPGPRVATPNSKGRLVSLSGMRPPGR
jgi:hypothetical protein